jgi:hypothetical protein
MAKGMRGHAFGNLRLAGGFFKSFLKIRIMLVKSPFLPGF